MTQLCVEFCNGLDRAVFPHPSAMLRTKAKGRALLRDPALSFRFSETRFGARITTFVIPESLGNHELLPAFSLLFHDHSRRKKLSTTTCFQLPGPSLVADSLRWPLVRFPLWKIALPLKAILLSTNENASGSDKFLLWK
jgi:hypothetical protein